MTILGSIQNGLSGDYSLLAIKSVLDGFAALAFASTLGVGVLFSVLVILVFQGGLTLLAAQLNAIIYSGNDGRDDSSWRDPPAWDCHQQSP